MERVRACVAAMLAAAATSAATATAAAASAAAVAASAILAALQLARHYFWCVAYGRSNVMGHTSQTMEDLLYTGLWLHVHESNFWRLFLLK